MEFIYKNLQAEYEKLIVTDADVDEQIMRLQQQNPRIIPVTDRPAQNGDEVVLDYAGFCGGEQFAGGTAEKQTLVLGSGMFIPGFEEQLVGASIGEERVVKVTFPEAYHAENLAGKEAEFRCKIHEIREKASYELDDAFAKEVGKCDSYEILRKRVAESLQAYSDERAEFELQDKLMRQAAATLDFTPTQEELTEAVDAQINAMQAQLAQRGLSLEMYCQFTGSTMDKLRADAKSEAENSLRMQRTAMRIALLEGLEPTDEEIEREVELVCRQNGATLEQLRPYMDAKFHETVRENARMRKAIAFVRMHAKVTVREVTPNKHA
ncbi:MAG: trigger factor [Oscillospiraceae bacterium]|nr:trigger factor [Oscillospiraceae bacterium]